MIVGRQQFVARCIWRISPAGRMVKAGDSEPQCYSKIVENRLIAKVDFYGERMHSDR